MADRSLNPGLEPSFTALLAALSPHWAAQDIDYVRDIVVHAEYRDALENVVAIADRTPASLGADELGRVESIAAFMSTSLAAIRAENRLNHQLSVSAA